MTLPAAAEALAHEAIEPRARTAVTSSGAPLGGTRVLMVHDNQGALEWLAGVLRAHGAEVATTGSAAEAYDAAGAFRPDVLVSDIDTPGEDGCPLIGRVRALPPERGGRTPASLTAYARADDRLRARDAGFQLHMPKSVDPVELAVAIKSLASTSGVAEDSTGPREYGPDEARGHENS